MKTKCNKCSEPADVITAIESYCSDHMPRVITQHTPTPWYLVVNTPGVDIRHKFEGQELTLIENVNYQIANKVIRAVNSHEALLKMTKLGAEVLRAKGEISIAMELEKTIKQAEKGE